MIQFRNGILVTATVLFAAFVFGCFTGCDEDDEPWPPPSVAGTYYGIGNFGAGDQSVRLVIQASYSTSLGGGSGRYGSVEAVAQTLSGLISYGGDTYVISGAAEDDSVDFAWTTADGIWMLSGTWDEEGIRGVTNGPGGTYDFVAYRQPAGGNNITGVWHGWFESTEGPDQGFLLGHLVQSDSVVTGFLVTSFEDTFTISDGSFQEPIIAISAADSTGELPITMVLGGLLVTADSATGTYNFIWEGGSDAGTWDLVRTINGDPEPPDTGDAFSGLVGVVYIREGIFLSASGASVYWEIEGEGVTGATITVNGITVQELGSGSYLTMAGALTVVPGEEYTFSVYHPDYGSTSGTAQVPGDFDVTAPLPDSVITMGEDLVVTFTESTGATFYTAMLEGNSAFGSTEAPATSITLPGSDIQTAGDDVLEVEAMWGDYNLWQESGTGYFGLYGKVVTVTVQ